MLRTKFLIFCLVFVYDINCHPALDGRIIGGTPVNITACPYQLSLQYRGYHICGASVISSKYGLTAAHCVVEKSVSSMSVYAGSNSYKTGGVRLQVASVTYNPNYNPDTSEFDIAVIECVSALPFSDKILPIALPVQNEITLPGAVGVVCGWGYTQEDSGIVSPVLRKVHVPIVDRKRCRQFFRDKGNVTHRMMCAGVAQGGFDACQGDSGGPLVVNRKIKGIVSWGYGCGRPGYPGVYTRVSKFINWINRLVK